VLQHAAAQITRVGVRPRDEERHHLRRVDAAVRLVDQLEEAGVVVGTQLQPWRAAARSGSTE
jgi:hypothetical protein